MKKLIAYLIVALAVFCDALNPLKARYVALSNAIVNRTVIHGVRSLKFARDGSDDGGTAVSTTHQPAADAAAYVSLGDVEDGSIESKEDTLQIRNASGGNYQRRRSIPLSMEMMLKFTMQNVNQLSYEALYKIVGQAAGAELTIGTEYQPLTKTAPITGWLELKVSDQTKTNTLLHYLWVELDVKSLKVAEKEYKHELEVTVLDNALNSVEIDALAANF